mgnify:CR=1 FL=1
MGEWIFTIGNRKVNIASRRVVDVKAANCGACWQGGESEHCCCDSSNGPQIFHRLALTNNHHLAVIASGLGGLGLIPIASIGVDALVVVACLFGSLSDHEVHAHRLLEIANAGAAELGVAI